MVTELMLGLAAVSVVASTAIALLCAGTEDRVVDVALARPRPRHDTMECTWCGSFLPRSTVECPGCGGRAR